jgi:hypothetical protein
MHLVEFGLTGTTVRRVHVNRDTVTHLQDGTPGKSTLIHFDAKDQRVIVDGPLSEVAEKLKVGH